MPPKKTPKKTRSASKEATQGAAQAKETEAAIVCSAVQESRDHQNLADIVTGRMDNMANLTTDAITLQSFGQRLGQFENAISLVDLLWTQIDTLTQVVAAGRPTGPPLHGRASRAGDA